MIVNQIKNEYICCICIQSCLISEKDIHTCKICKGGNTTVCGDCIAQSLEYGYGDLFKKCPVCRSENWSIYTPKIRANNNKIIKCNCQLNMDCNFKIKIVKNILYILRTILYTGIFFCVGMLTFYIAKGKIFSGESLILDIFLYILVGSIMTLLSIFFISCFTLSLCCIYANLKRVKIRI